MRRVVVDPGVLVSAALTPRGNPARIVEAVGSGEVVLVVSPDLLTELQRVLSRPRLVAGLDSRALANLWEVVAAAPVLHDPPPVAVSRDPKDNYLVALARSSGAEALVSGDKDLTVLTDLLPPILTPAAFVAQLKR